MSCAERCPHCLIVPMVAFTNGWGGCFLTCLDCGYSDPIRRRTAREAVVRKGLWPETAEEGLALLRKEAQRLGRPPKVIELGPTTPTQGWCRNKFGSIRQAYEAAGLELPRRGNRTGKNGAESRRGVPWNEASRKSRRRAA